MITQPEWNSIRAAVESISADVSGRRQDYLQIGRVVKRSVANKTVWLDEFGNQPIPIVAFDYEVKYYDTDSNGKVHAKTAKVSVATPKIGETVLVAREMGIQRLPRCIGVLKGKNWIIAEEM